MLIIWFRKFQYATVQATQGFPECRELGIIGQWRKLALTGVEKNKWADKSTNLREFIGWRFAQVNSRDVKTETEFDETLAHLNTGDAVTFTLKKFNAEV